MINFSNYKVILWDFDGVIMDSMPIRGNGFKMVLRSFPEAQVDELMAFHEKNGGLSRYIKFRYFFEEIRGESITEDEVNFFSENFSEIMLASLVDEKLLIHDSLDFIKENYNNYEMHIVSGSDEKELRKICESIDISKYFKSINGSPTPKKQLVSTLINKWNYSEEEIVLIGDSINDFEAATDNKISFIGYNNDTLNSLCDQYVSRFSDY